MDTPNTEEKQMKDVGLKVGQFHCVIDNQDYIINPLSQDDIASGWQTVLPRVYKHSTIHHFNIYLSQLPPHLWSQYKKFKSVEKPQITLHDRIYHYTIKQSKYDDNILALYNEVSRPYPKRAVISEIYNQLDNQKIRGWIMTRSRFYIK